MNGGFNWKITDKGAMFQGYVKLPEGKHDHTLAEYHPIQTEQNIRKKTP